jgi:hypothetical protein
MFCASLFRAMVSGARWGQGNRRKVAHVRQQHRQDAALKLQALRAAIQAGIGELKRGEFIDVGDADLEGLIANGLGD